MLSVEFRINVPETHVVAPDHPLPPPDYVSVRIYYISNATYIDPTQTAVQMPPLHKAI
jgi:hypothetical protein